MTPADLERLERKLDLIIRSLGLDGGRTKQDNQRTAEKVVDMMLKRQLTKSRRKPTRE
ncbi:MAG: hypothetical protein A4E63_01210 [Syntrophorhabdus sp. PtaU1.Bin050]|nr:MAG: hypothetical protein A4E63_01210 [Syntrophorhabdus sp. PtaU1.Bin050]